jgi:hypothetical protein
MDALVMALGVLLLSVAVWGLYGFWYGLMTLGIGMVIGVPIYRS